MSNEPSSSQGGFLGFLLILGLPVSIAGLIALMIFISIGHDREDPGPGVLEEEVAKAETEAAPATPDAAEQ